MGSLGDWRWQRSNWTWGQINKIYSVWTTERNGLKSNKQSLKDLWDNKSGSNLQNDAPEGEERESGAERVDEITAENFPDLTKDISLRIQEVESKSSKINPEKFMPRHMITKLLKTKGKKPWKQWERSSMYPTGNTSSNDSEFLLRPWRTVDTTQHVQVLEVRSCPLQILYLVKLSFSKEGETETPKWRKSKSSLH